MGIIQGISKTAKQLEEVVAKVPKGTDSARAKIEREFAEEAARKAALYTAAPIANKTGKDAIAQAKKTLAPKQSGKEKFLSSSSVKEPVYHAAKTDVKEFSPEYRTSVSNMGHHFGTADQANFRIGQYDFDSPSPNIGKYYLNIQNPLEVTHMGSFAPDHLAEQMMDMGILTPQKYEKIQDKNSYFDIDVGSDLVTILKKNGYDGLKYANEREGEGFSFVPFDSTQIKSAIGNRGTYDINEADITKAHGGVVRMANGGEPRKYVPPSQLFPINKDYEPVTRNRAGQVVKNPNEAFTGALTGLWNELAGATRGMTVGTFGLPGDILDMDTSKPFITPSDTQTPPPENPMYSMLPAPQIRQRKIVPDQYLPKVPTTEDLNRMLPSAGDSHEAKVAGQLGEYLSPLDIVPTTKAIYQGVKAAVPVVKKAASDIAPRAANLAEEYAARTQMGMPFEMNVVPKSDAEKAAYAAAMREKYAAQNAARAAKAVEKVPEVKVPANDLGFYSSVEKAAMNLQRKSGNGDAFISDLLKNPDVSPSKLEETGLMAALKGRTGVTRDEVQLLAEKGKVPLTESIGRDIQETSKPEYLKEEAARILGGIQMLKNDMFREIARYGDDSASVNQIRQKIETMQNGYDDILNQIEKNKQAKFAPSNSPSLSTPGGKNYREIRIKTPEVLVDPIDTSKWSVYSKDDNSLLGQRTVRVYDEKADTISVLNNFRGKDEDAIAEAAKQHRKLLSEDKNYYNHNHHGDEANVVAHLRVADHVDVEGKKGLLIDENQSDPHQRGRKQGYRTPIAKLPSMSADELFDKHYEDLSSAQRNYLKDFMERWEPAANFGKDKDLDKLIKEYDNWISKQYLKGVVDLPFKEDWYQLGLKRAIKEAVDTGMDRVYLTKGQTQADRYDMSKHIKELNYDPTYKHLTGIGNSGEEINKIVQPNELSEYLGEELANKLISSNPVNGRHKLTGLDMKIGGEGMKQWYDKNYLNWLKKYAKEHGATVGTTRLPSAVKKRSDLNLKEMHEYMDNPEFKKILDEEMAKTTGAGGRIEPQGDGNYKIVWDDGTFSGGYSEQGAIDRLSRDNTFYSQTGNRAWNAALKRFGGQEVYYLDLNPALKNTAKKGQSYAQGGSVQSNNGFDYESHIKNIIDKHNSDNFDYEGHYKKIMNMSNGGLSVKFPSLKYGGKIPLMTKSFR